MDTNIDTYSITDLRHKTNKVLSTVASKGIAYVIRHSKATAAVINIDYLNALTQAYEDYCDIVEFDRTIGLKRVPLEHLEKKTIVR